MTQPEHLSFREKLYHYYYIMSTFCNYYVIFYTIFRKIRSLYENNIKYHMEYRAQEIFSKGRLLLFSQGRLLLISG